MTRFVALLQPMADRGHALVFPDLPGCVAAERDMRSLFDAAPTVLRLHLAGLSATGLPPPSPRTLAQIIADPALRRVVDGATFASVPLPPSQPRDPSDKAVAPQATLLAPALVEAARRMAAQAPDAALGSEQPPLRPLFLWRSERVRHLAGHARGGRWAGRSRTG